MDFPIDTADSKLDGLVKRAEAGESVQLTRNGHVVARIVPASRQHKTPRFDRAEIDAIVASAREKLKGQPADLGEDLYDEVGAPK